MKSRFSKTISVLLAVLMLISSVFVAPTVGAETAEDDVPFSISENYEEVTDVSVFQTTAMTPTVVDDGSGSNKVLNLVSTQGGYCGVNFFGKTVSLTRDAKYHLSGSFKVISGTFKVFTVGLMNGMNIWNINTNGLTVSPRGTWGDVTAANNVVDFAVTYTAGGGNTFGIMLDANSEGATIQFDNIKLSQVVDYTISATSENEEQGTATARNANGKYVDSQGVSTYAEGEKVAFLAIPKKGYKFAGWKKANGETVPGGSRLEMDVANDLALTATFVPSDISDYEIYVDFENASSLATTVGEQISIVNEPGSDSYNNVVFYKGKSTEMTQPDMNRRFVVTYNDFNNDKLDDFYTKGDRFTVEFKYKFADNNAESVKCYFGASHQGSNAWVINNSPNVFAGNGVSSVELTNPKNGSWVTVKRYIEIVGDEPEKYHYLLMLLGGNSDVYFDDFVIYKTHEVAVNYTNETVRLEETDEKNPISNALVGKPLTFKALCDKDVVPTVKYGETVLTPSDGIYTIDSVNQTDELTVTTTGQTEAQDHEIGVGVNGEDLTKYNCADGTVNEDVVYSPYWEGDTVYHEAVMFTNSEDGIVQLEKSLVYPIEDVVSIRSSNLKEWYVKGVDFEITEDGKLKWLEGSKIPVYTGVLTVSKDANVEYNDPTVNTQGSTSYAAAFPVDDENGLYIMWDVHHERHTVYVTYTHSETWKDKGVDGSKANKPEAQGNKLSNFYNKLKTEEDINVLVYGDSVASGAASTGANVNYELFDKEGNVTERGTGSEIKLTPYFELATNNLVSLFGNNNKVNYYNLAVGGVSSEWGNSELENRIGYMNEYYGKEIIPDVIYIDFCGNDYANARAGKYKENIQGIVAKFKAKYPNADIILMSSKVDNSRSTALDIETVMLMEEKLNEIAAENANCIVVNRGSQWVDITASKNPEDYLSNNINHANNYWAMITAQYIVATCSPSEKSTITFKNWDGTVLSSKEYNNGDVLTAPAAPTKPGDANYNYVFAGWDSEIVPCDGEKTYTAVFKAVLKYVNADGTTLIKQADGSYRYMVNGEYKNVTTLCNYYGTWWYVEKGKVNFGATTLCKYGNTWWYVEKGKVNFGATTLCKYGNTWYYVQRGQVNFGATTLCKYGNTWYYVQRGQVNFGATTLCKYGNTWYYVQGGKVNFGATTLCKYGNTWYYVQRGQVNFGATTLCKYGNTWYYVQKGAVNFGATTLCKYGNTWYYVQNGQVNFGATLRFKYYGTYYNVVKGVVKF